MPSILLPRFYQERVVQAKKQANVILESNAKVKKTTATAAGGDKRQLRGIPVIGGVGGTMLGTDPLQQVLKH